MLAHAGGAATLDAPPWLLAYGATALVLLVTVTLRGRVVVAAAGAEPNGGGANASTLTSADTDGDGDGDGDEADASASEEPDAAAEPRPGGWRADGRVVGRVAGVVTLGTVAAAAFVGPDASAANLAPSAVLAVWWVGLPLACVVAGDVMGWLDPFGTLARLVPRARSHPGADGAPTWTAPLFLAAFAWWELAYHDARSPRSLGWLLVGYTAAAVTGAVVWGRSWLGLGEGFGALSSALARARRAALGRDDGGARDDSRRSDRGLVALVAVWLGAVVFDLFSGTRAWVGIAGHSSGWARTGRATGCLLAAVVLAWIVVAGTVRAADRPRTAKPRPAVTVSWRIERAVALAWLCATAGAFLAHGITLMLVDGQFTLALVSDPFGRGWDLFGTALRTVDYSPLSVGAIGAVQLVAAVGGATWGVVVAVRTVQPVGRSAPEARTALRVLWVVGVSLAVATAVAVAVLSADLE